MIVSGMTLLIHLSVTEPRLPRKPATHLSLSHDRIWVRSLRKLFYDPLPPPQRGCPAGDPGSLAVLTRRVII